MEVEVYFFGVLRAGHAGHYLYTPTGGCAWPPWLPWPRHDLDGGLTWNAGAWRVNGANRWREPARGVSVQGDAALRYRDGWTALSWHDFTGDAQRLQLIGLRSWHLLSGTDVGAA